MRSEGVNGPNKFPAFLVFLNVFSYRVQRRFPGRTEDFPPHILFFVLLPGLQDDVVCLGCSQAGSASAMSQAASNDGAAVAVVPSAPFPATAAGEGAQPLPSSRKKARLTPTTGSSEGGSVDVSGGGAFTNDKVGMVGVDSIAEANLILVVRPG